MVQFTGIDMPRSVSTWFNRLVSKQKSNIWLTPFSNVFFRMKIDVCLSKSYLICSGTTTESISLVEATALKLVHCDSKLIGVCFWLFSWRYWRRYWLGVPLATSHYLNQWWPSILTHTHMCVCVCLCVCCITSLELVAKNIILANIIFVIIVLGH